MAMTPEGRVKAAVKKWLKARGIWFFCPVSNGMGVHGIPDFICCWQGRFLAIETKAPGRIKEVSAPQQLQLSAIQDANGLALVVDDVSLLEEHFGEGVSG